MRHGIFMHAGLTTPLATLDHHRKAKILKSMPHAGDSAMHPINYASKSQPSVFIAIAASNNFRMTLCRSLMSGAHKLCSHVFANPVAIEAGSTPLEVRLARPSRRS